MNCWFGPRAGPQIYGYVQNMPLTVRQRLQGLHIRLCQVHSEAEKDLDHAQRCQREELGEQVSHSDEQHQSDESKVHARQEQREAVSAAAPELHPQRHIPLAMHTSV